jgi:hypothetical protein
VRSKLGPNPSRTAAHRPTKASFASQLRRYEAEIPSECCAATASTVSGDPRLVSDTRACKTLYYTWLLRTLILLRFSVTGWSIRQAKSADAAAGECNEGDMIYEVSFERKDPVLMEEVMKRPTATEVDDYVEFKRLSKLHREGKNILPASNSTQPLMRADIRLVTKTAPPIAPSEKLGPTHRNELESKSSHGSSIRKPTFKRMHFDKPEDSPYQPPDIVSPRTVPSLNSFPLDPNKPGTLSVPPKSEESPLRTSHDKSSSEPRTLASPSVASSGLATSNLQIREVAPWIDFDAGLALPDAADVSPVTLDVTSLKASGGSRTNTSVMEAPKKRKSGEWFGTHLGLKGIFHQGHGEVGG